MATITICDKCEKKIEEGQRTLTLTEATKTLGEDKITWYLCDNCFRTMRTILKDYLPSM